MVKETELRIARAVQTTFTPYSVLAAEWNVSTRTIARIAKKYGVHKDGDGENLRRAERTS